VELATLVMTDDHQACQRMLPAALDFHRLIADKASAHLSLVASNVFRSQWLAAACLDRSAPRAQAAAQNLVQRILRTPADARSPFEKHLFLEYELWSALVDFSEARPPVCLWKGRRHFEALFRLLAVQFLCSPDHILDCERIHARWQWLCTIKRGVKLPALNATLRLTQYLERNSEDFPPHEALADHIAAARAQLRWEEALVEANEDIGRGWRQEMLWASRFNLRPEDMDLLAPRGPAAAPGGADYERTWRTYMRLVFVRGHWFCFAERPEVIFYVMDNKVLAGREERGDTEASSRNLVVVFYEAFEVGAHVVRRVQRDNQAVHPKLLTVPELMLTCGVGLAPRANRTSAEQELDLEEHFAELDLQRFRGVLETSASEDHVYSLEQEGNAEDAYLRETPIEALTKVALCRALERCTGEPRRPAWLATLQHLRERARPFLEPAAAAAGATPGPALEALKVAPRARGRGRGRGGRARGRRGA
jgi:hypothetical protein